MTPENIEAIASKYAQKHNEYPYLSSLHVIKAAIKEALDLNDKSEWKYPEKGELPEVLEHYLIFYLKGGGTKPKVGMAYKDSGGLMMFFCNDTKKGYSQHTVKCWMYAPAQCEG